MCSRNSSSRVVSTPTRLSWKDDLNFRHSANFKVSPSLWSLMVRHLFRSARFGTKSNSWQSCTTKSSRVGLGLSPTSFATVFGRLHPTIPQGSGAKLCPEGFRLPPPHGCFEGVRERVPTFFPRREFSGVHREDFFRLTFENFCEDRLQNLRHFGVHSSQIYRAPIEVRKNLCLGFVGILGSFLDPCNNVDRFCTSFCRFANCAGMGLRPSTPCCHC